MKITEETYYKAVEALKANGRGDYLERLDALFQAEHGGCDDNTCGMTVAYDAGYSTLACELFASSGAASDEFYRLWSALPKRALKTVTDFESIAFNEDADCKSVGCGCGAYVYRVMASDRDAHCNNCGKTFGLHPADTL